MSTAAYRSSIPADAVEVVEERRPSGAKKSASYFVDGEQVGHRLWDEDGRLELESALRGGVKHGREYRFYPDGRPFELETYHNGQLHGVGKQWAEDGRLLVTWKLVHGTGLDLWCDEQGRLAEEHYWPREGEAGYQREWNPDGKTVSQEFYYRRGQGNHGPWREWNADGRLRRGFPHFFINDHRVTRKEYLRACQTDATLPPYRPEDDDQRRKLPAEYRAQQKKRPAARGGRGSH